MEQHLTDVLIFYYMGDLHLILPALNLSIVDADIFLIIMQEIGLLRFSSNMVDYPIHYIGRVEKNMFCYVYSLMKVEISNLKAQKNRYLQDTHKT